MNKAVNVCKLELVDVCEAHELLSLLVLWLDAVCDESMSFCSSPA